jgi:hypothetical protein
MFFGYFFLGRHYNRGQVVSDTLRTIASSCKGGLACYRSRYIRCDTDNRFTPDESQSS